MSISSYKRDKNDRTKDSVKFGSKDKDDISKNIKDSRVQDQQLEASSYNRNFSNKEDQSYDNKIDTNRDLVNESHLSNASFAIPMIDPKDIASGKASSTAIIAYLTDKIRFLEAENRALSDEVTKHSSLSDKEKVSYYLRLRKELIEENEKLMSEKKMREISFKGELEKLTLEIKDLKDKLKKTPLQTIPEMRSGNVNISNSQVPQATQLPPSQVEGFANTKFFKNCETLAKVEEDKASIQKLLKEQKDRQIGPKNSIYNLNKKDHNNPFIPVIDDLEERVKLLEKTIHEKEAEILELNEVINTNEQIASRAQIALRLEINKWKEKYLLILATRKTISQEFSELNIKTTENIKKSMAKQTYDMESKILHLEKLNYKLNEDMKAMTKADHDHDKQKLSEIINLKRDLKALLENYDDLYRNYEESLKILTKQIDSIKQLYLTRENEFINLTNYYIETINDFSKPITDLANAGNARQLEEALIAQNKQTEEMRKVAEKYIKENSMIKSENFESKAIMRQKINDAMKFYDESIKNISDNHNSIESKLTKISEFMETFDQKFILFNSLIEDKKALSDKVNELEVKIRMMSNDDQTKEIINLRETNFKLSKELEAKVMLMKDMEDAQEAFFNMHTDNHIKNKGSSNTKGINTGSIQNNSLGQTLISNFASAIKSNLGSPNSNSARKLRVKEVSADTLMKMKSEISTLSSEILLLQKSKEEIEHFYQEEVKKLISNLEEKNEIIEELKSALSKNENEHFAKKETIFNLWMIEFKEFKENLITISDIRNIVEKFKIEGGELKIQRDKLVNEEIYLLRQEIKTKDKSISDLKTNLKKENQSINEVLDQYKKHIDVRITALDNLLQQRQNEITALKNEKVRLQSIEARKKEVKAIIKLIILVD